MEKGEEKGATLPCPRVNCSSQLGFVAFPKLGIASESTNELCNVYEVKKRAGVMLAI